MIALDVQRGSQMSEGAPTRSPRPSLVIADDVPAIRTLLRHTLEESFDVLGEAADGEEAVELAVALRPDVLLLDLNMPGQDGLQAIRAVRERAPRTRIVVLTGLEPAVVEHQARELGAIEFLEKTAPLDDVHDRLRALVGEPPAADRA